MNKSHLTAISRKTLPLPTRWLMEHDFIKGNVLDYGCGHCAYVNPLEWDNYDPYHYPALLDSGYDTIICNYVLCVLPSNERMTVLKNIQRELNAEGKAYISVRNDKPKQGWGVSKRGTYQGRVRGLPLKVIHKCSQFRTYLLTPDDKLA